MRDFTIQFTDSLTPVCVLAPTLEDALASLGRAWSEERRVSVDKRRAAA